MRAEAGLMGIWIPVFMAHFSCPKAENNPNVHKKINGINEIWHGHTNGILFSLKQEDRSGHAVTQMSFEELCSVTC